MNFKEYDKNLLLDNYKTHLKDENFKKLVKSFKLDDEVLMKYTSNLEETLEELENCRKCKGLALCKNKVKGFVFYPSVVGNMLKFNYVACLKQKEHLKRISVNADYVKMPTSLKEASMKDIYVKDKKRIPIIKFLKNFYDSYDHDKNQKGLFLHGSFGSGKTYLICAMLNELSKKGVDVKICYYPELLRSLKESFNGGDFSSKINSFKNASVLFLDDIGAEAVTPWARDEVLGTILQYRMDSKLPTFFTSNLNINELESHLENTKEGVDKVKARRIIERIKYLTVDIELVSKNLREI